MARSPSSAPKARPPSVERVVSAARAEFAGRDEPDHAAIVAVARSVIAAERMRLSNDRIPKSMDGARSVNELAGEVTARLRELTTTRVARVINATGVIVHTNLGRAPWPAAAIEAARAAAERSLFLELDEATGRRGRRYRQAEEHLIALTGAEDALVVNNNAAGVALAVGLAGRGGVVVSRGELVEIGGGVRIPEVIRRAGARLIEVGTTNRTRAADFEEPLVAGRARIVLRVHLSNFRQTGFVESPDPHALAELAHRHGAWLIDDLGSGALLDTAFYGLGHEPTPSEALEAGADLVTFSGDKLLGGPQAGLIVGRAELIGRLRRDPLARAMRPDKTTLVALAATLGLYRAGRAAEEIPVWRMIGAPLPLLLDRARAIVQALGQGADGVSVRASVVDLEATVGGGSLPTETLPSAGVRLSAPHGEAAKLLDGLRRGEPPIVARAEGGGVVFDLRTVEPDDDPLLVAALRAVLIGEAATDRR